MSLLSSIKKALGFPDEYDDADDVDLIQQSSDTTAQPPATTPAKTSQTPIPDIDTTAITGHVFDAVIELFNSIQPEFVRQALDTDKQRAYLMSNIDSSLRSSLEAIALEARRKGEIQWQNEKSKLTADMDSMRSEYNSLCRQREEHKTAELSATRQKRALNERIHDLESKVTSLEAEKEQYMLESRSMANKLRVANVRSMSSDPESDEALQKLIADNDSLTATIEKLTAELSASRQENEAQVKVIEELRQRPASPTVTPQELEEIESQLKQFEDIKRKKDARIAELKDAIKASQAKIDESMRLVNERDTTIATLQSQTVSLSKTIEDNLYAHASVEAELKEEIRRLSELVNVAADIPAQNEGKRKRNDRNKSRDRQTPPKESAPAETEAVKISAIDELMDNTDWFVAPEPTPLKKSPEVEEEFGYREPAPSKKNSRDDDKQLSLW